MDENKVFKQYIDYHGAKFKALGFDPKVVWNRKESQHIRYSVMCRMIDRKSGFSVLDIGSGLSDFYRYLLENGYHDFNYVGYEINPDMVKAVQEKYPGIEVHNGSYAEIWSSGNTFDYIVACGIHAFGESDKAVQEYFIEKYKMLFEKVNRAMGINFLSIYSPSPDQLSVYHNPADVLTLCIKTFGPTAVTLYHNYLPNDFTVIIQKGR